MDCQILNDGTGQKDLLMPVGPVKCKLNPYLESAAISPRRLLVPDIVDLCAIRVVQRRMFQNRMTGHQNLGALIIGELGSSSIFCFVLIFSTLALHG